MNPSTSLRFAMLSATAAVLAACASTPSSRGEFQQSNLPEAVKVPAGNRVALETVGIGEITYECRAKKDAADQFEWAFVGPNAKLMDRAGNQVGKYYGPPATWESSDGSKLTGAQVATAPAAAGNIPLQLVKANPASGAGAMWGITYIQRVATQGGVAPSMHCVQGNAGAKQIVKYRADYIMWRADGGAASTGHAMAWPERAVRTPRP